MFIPPPPADLPPPTAFEALWPLAVMAILLIASCFVR